MNTSTLQKVVAPPVSKGSDPIGAARSWLSSKLSQYQSTWGAEKISITPALATAMLERNPQNRRLREQKVHQYMSDILNHRFEFNGETVVFARSGELNDGQHRLAAIIAAKKPLDLLVVFGVERDTRYTLDSGAARTAGEQLTLKGYSHANVAAAAAKLSLSYNDNDCEVIGRTGEISNARAVKLVESDPLLRECAAWVSNSSAKTKLFAKQSYLTFIYYELTKKSPKKAKTFMEGLKEGIGLSGDNPIRKLREKLTLSPKLTGVQRTECFFRAWNAWLNDRELQQVRVTGKLPVIES